MNFHLSNEGMIIMICIFSIGIAIFASYMASRQADEDQPSS